MRLFTLFFMCCFSLFAFSQDGWNDQTPGQDLPGLQGVFALDGSNIWVVGEEGTILHSLDGGENWTEIGGVTTVTLYTVEFINADTGWIAGNDDNNQSTMFRTTDGGLTWESQSLQGPGDYVYIQDVDFIERPGTGSVRGYCAGGLSYTWLTDDYGASWSSINGGCGDGSIESCFIIDENTGWFVGYASTVNPSTIVLMTEAGGTWTTQTNPTDQPLLGVCFANESQGIAVGLVGTIINTNDGGETWISRPNEGYRWQATYMTEGGKSWAVGNAGNIAYSPDYGDSWSMQESGAECELWDVFFIDENEGWVVGGGIGQPGVILHTTNGGMISGVVENKATMYSMQQNNPNPFSVSTSISYRLKKPAFVTLSVYNMLGEEICTLVNEFQKTGEYTVQFEPFTEDNGIYYTQLKIGGKPLITRKMALVH